MYFPYKFIGRRGIRRTFAVIFVRLAYVVENDVPCFVRHMAKEIFFLYLTGFQYFDCPVCRSFGMFFRIKARKAASELFVSWKCMVAIPST